MAIRELARRAAPGLRADRARRYGRAYRERQGITAAAKSLVGAGRVCVGESPFRGLEYPADRIADVTRLARSSTASTSARSSTCSRATGQRSSMSAAQTLSHGRDGTSEPGAGQLRVRYRAQCPDPLLGGRPAKRRGGPGADRWQIYRRLDRRASGLLLCDIEGGEDDLFKAPLVDRLRGWTVVVEAHEHLVPGVTSRLQPAFYALHSVRMVEQSPRTAMAVPLGAQLAFVENKPPELHWLVFEPRHQLSAA